MSAHSLRHRIASALAVPPDSVEVVPPRPGGGLLRVGRRSWALTPEMVDQAEELINRVVFACRQSPAGRAR